MRRQFSLLLIWVICLACCIEVSRGLDAGMSKWTSKLELMLKYFSSRRRLQRPNAEQILLELSIVSCYQAGS